MMLCKNMTPIPICTLQGDAQFTPQNINPYLCTHLIYAFGGLGKDDTLVPFDEYQDIEKGELGNLNGLFA